MESHWGTVKKDINHFTVYGDLEVKKIEDTLKIGWEIVMFFNQDFFSLFM